MKVPFLEEKQRLMTLRTPARKPVDWTIPGLSDLYFPEESDADRDDHPWFVAPGSRDIVDVLVETGKLSAAQRNKVRQGALANPGRTLEELLPKWQMVGPEDVLEAKARLYGIEFRRIRPADVDRKAFDLLDIDFIRDNGIIPVSIDGDLLVVGTSEPENVFVLQEIRKQTQMELEVLVCSRSDVLAACEYLERQAQNQDADHAARQADGDIEDPVDHSAILEEDANSASADQDAGYGIEDIISHIRDAETEKNEDADRDICQSSALAPAQPVCSSPVVEFVNYVITSAVKKADAAISIDPRQTSVKITYHIDGVIAVDNGIATIDGTLDAVETSAQAKKVPLTEVNGR